MKGKKILKLVADSAAFIRNAPMQDIAEVVYTIRDVVDEIRDQATKQRLRVLPYEIKMQEPSVESIIKMTEFAKKTGDYASLSATDIKVLALVYELEVEANGADHLKSEPQMKKSIVVSPRPPGSDQVDKIAGFYLPKADEVDELADQVAETKIEEEVVDDEDEGSDGDSDEKEEVEEEEEDDGDDDDGWITPANIEHVKHSMSGVLESVQLEVACLTTDFAMQNVLMQMGLHVVSLEGRLIHEARTYILRCYACFRTTTNVTKVFCPKCGNKTLKKVAVSLSEDGTMQIHISSRKRLTARGKKYSLPMPKGGKHAVNPILVEDQREAQQRSSRLGRTKTNALDPDYITGDSPFAVNDVYSRAAQLGRTGRSNQNYWNRRNPAEFRKKR
nr:EOG090X07WR [Ilyocryptus agilis]